MNSSNWVFVHGWAQSRMIWRPFFDVWPQARFVNLPGHGGVPEAAPGGWHALPFAKKPVVLIGWSLGGMLALRAALEHPERVKGLVLVSTTPRFCQGADWPCGCPPTTFAAFEQAASEAQARLLGRFFSLMLHGDEIERRQIRSLAQACVDRRHPPSRQAMQDGLKLLRELDLRRELPKIRIPALIVHGDRDEIVPVEAGRYLHDQLPQAQLHIFQRCGHAPFLTRTNAFQRLLEEWCQRL